MVYISSPSRRDAFARLQPVVLLLGQRHLHRTTKKCRMALPHVTPPAAPARHDRTMILNMGPQHPSTHGVLRLVLEIDGGTVVRLTPGIGFLHMGIENTCEASF